MGSGIEVVTDGKVEVRADWEEPDAPLFWRSRDGGGLRHEGQDEGARDGWQPSLYLVGDFDHDHARALRVMSALWHFLHGAAGSRSTSARAESRERPAALPLVGASPHH